MAIIYSNDISDLLDEIKHPITTQNHKNPDENYPIRSETITLKKDSDNKVRILLDYTINIAKEITVLDIAENDYLTIIGYPQAPSSTQVSVSLNQDDIPILLFHSSMEDKSVTISYYPYSSYIDSKWCNKIEKAIDGIGEIDDANYAKLDAINTFAKKQKIDAENSSEGIEISASENPKISLKDRVFDEVGNIVFSGDNNAFIFDRNIEAPYFFGDGVGITNLIANNITSGTVPLARLHPDVATKNGTNTLTNPFNTFTGTFTGNGAALNSLNATNISSGTLADARLSSNIPKLNASNTFSGSVNFQGGIVARVRALSGAGTHNVLDSDYYLLIDVGAGNVTYNLPSATVGKSFIFVTSNNGGSNTATFKAVTGQNVNTPTTFDNTWVSTPGSPSKKVYYVTSYFTGQWFVTSYQPNTN